MNEIEDKKLKDQQTNALLRERFLRLISKLSGGYNCRIRLYEDSNVTCNVKGFDAGFENVIVENLVTRYPKPIPQALIRMNDVISLHFEVETL